MWFHKRFDFHKMLHQQAQMSEEGLRLLCDFVEAPSPELGDKVKAVEKEADGQRRELIEALNLTFVTPFDREDVFSLSRAIDDMIDSATVTVEEIRMFEVSTNSHLQKMALALSQASQFITVAVHSLGQRRRRETHEFVIRAKKSENLMEHLYHEALVELFKSPDVIRILKLREIYRHLNSAADRGGEAADIISDILMKNA